jgi:hypothetical protein
MLWLRNGGAMKAHEKLRFCECCGMPKQTYKNFSYNCKKHDYSPNCKECGVWLKLFREAFGKARYMDRVRECQRRMYREKKAAPAVLLQQVWGIGK